MNSETIEVKNYSVVGVSGTHFASVTTSKKTPKTNVMELVLFFTLVAGPGECIKIKPNVFIRAILENPMTGSIIEKKIDSSANSDLSFVNLVTYIDGTTQTLAGDLNDFNNYPIQNISGRLFFSIPLDQGFVFRTALPSITNK